MTLASITPTGKASLVASATSQSVLLPLTGSPTTCLVTNLGSQVAYVVLSTSASTVASPSNAAGILPGQALVLTRGSNTYLSAVGFGPLDIQLGN